MEKIIRDVLDQFQDGLISKTDAIEKILKASNESLSVRENVAKEKDCSTCRYRSRLSYNYPCSSCINQSHYKAI